MLTLVKGPSFVSEHQDMMSLGVKNMDPDTREPIVDQFISFSEKSDDGLQTSVSLLTASQARLYQKALAHVSACAVSTHISLFHVPGQQTFIGSKHASMYGGWRENDPDTHDISQYVFPYYAHALQNQDLDKILRGIAAIRKLLQKLPSSTLPYPFHFWG